MLESLQEMLFSSFGFGSKKLIAKSNFSIKEIVFSRYGSKFVFLSELFLVTC